MHLMDTDPEDRSPEARAPTPTSCARNCRVSPSRRSDAGHAQEAGGVRNEHGWAFEMKWDSVRTWSPMAGGRVRLLSRKGRDDTAAYFDVVDDLAALPVETAVLDGEVVVIDPQGQAGLRPVAAPDQPHPACRHRAGGQGATSPGDALRHPGAERAVLGQEAVRGAPGDPGGSVPRSRGRGCKVPPVFDGGLDAPSASRRSCWRAWWPSRSTSIYQPGRRALHLAQDEDPPASGGRDRRLETGQGREGGIGSLLMGIPTPDGLLYVGKVGSGFDDRMLDDLMALLGPLARETSPLVGVPREEPATRVGWSRRCRRGQLRRADRAGPDAPPRLARDCGSTRPRRGGLGGPPLP